MRESVSSEDIEGPKTPIKEFTIKLDKPAKPAHFKSVERCSKRVK